MRTVFLSYAYPPLRFPRAIQVAHLVRHSGLPELRVVAAEDPDASQDETLLSVAGTAATVRVPWSRRARAMRKLRWALVKDRYLAPDLFRPWARDAAATVLRRSLLDSGDVLVSFGQPMSDHLAAARVRRRTGVSWIAHFSDPWIDNPLIPRGRLARAVTLRQERETVQQAEAIVFTSESTAELVMRKYPDAWQEKVSVIPHCFDPALYPAPQSNDDSDRPLTMRYVGNFYRGRGPEPLFEALTALRERNPDVLRGARVELIGSSQLDPMTSQAAQRLPPDLVTVRGPASYLEALGHMRSADLLLLVDAPGPESVFLPSKLVEYLGAARPIVALTPRGEAAELVREAGGWCAAPGETRSASEMLEAALVATRALGPGEWGDPKLRARFSASAVASRLDGLIAGVAAGRPMRPGERKGRIPRQYRAKR